MSQFQVVDEAATKAKAEAVRRGEEAAAEAQRVESVEARDNTKTKRHTVTPPSSGLSFSKGVSGSPLGASEAGPGDAVRLGATQTQVAAAERLGYIEKTDGGSWKLTPKGAEVAGEPVPSEVEHDGSGGQQSEDKAEALPEAVEQAARIVDSLPEGTYEHYAARAVDGPEGVDADALAADLGVSKEEAVRQYNGVVNGFATEAAMYLRSTHGLQDGDEFVAWASAQKPQEFREAMMAQARGQLEAYDALAMHYKAHSAAWHSTDFDAFIGEHEAEGGEVVTIWKEGDNHWFHSEITGSIPLSHAFARGIVRKD